MKLNEVLSMLIKHDVKVNRGKRVKSLAKAKARKGNPNMKGGLPFVPTGAPQEVAVQGDQGQFSGMF